MIASGSHVPDIDAQAFGLPAGTALRYERPAEPLRRLLPSYAVLDSDRRIFTGPDSWALPGWTQLWILLTDGPITVRLRNRHYGALGKAVAYGSTSRAMPVTSAGGVTVVIDVSPLGWLRWFAGPADLYRDRITPLETLWSEDWIEALMAGLHASDRGPGVKAVLDQFFLARLPPPRFDEVQVARAMALLADSDFAESREIAAALGLSTQALLRLTRRSFGHPPKLLMRRARFLRVLAAMLMAETTPASSDVPPGYHDVPHFLRDGEQFLGLTPRRFLAMPMPYLRAVLRARTMAIGAPLPLLDPRPMPG